MDDTFDVKAKLQELLKIKPVIDWFDDTCIGRLYPFSPEDRRCASPTFVVALPGGKVVWIYLTRVDYINNGIFPQKSDEAKEIDLLKAMGQDVLVCSSYYEAQRTIKHALEDSKISGRAVLAMADFKKSQ